MYSLREITLLTLTQIELKIRFTKHALQKIDENHFSVEQNKSTFWSTNNFKVLGSELTQVPRMSLETIMYGKLVESSQELTA